ncbi:MAG: TolC family outer membrane protein [Hyphomicrobiales bacterium]|nr:TolC family outer membrane protein [Hyphomicrobiales bacterium]
MSLARYSIAAAIVLSVSGSGISAASAETIFGALTKAYQYNSTLNAGRAGVRVTDEGVAIAKSGWRPNVQGTSDLNYASNGSSGTRLTTGGFGVSIQQTLFDGFQTRNNVRGAEAQVRAQRENLRNTQETTLYDAASAYMDVILNRQIAKFRERNLAFLNEQVRAAKSRLDVGEGTRTDVAQAQASQALAQAQLAAARAQVLSSAATYHQIIGDEPGKLQPARPVTKLLPSSLSAAFAIAATEHPAIRATEALVDATEFSVKSAEGTLLPTLSAQAGVSRDYSHRAPGLPGVGVGTPNGWDNSASVGLSLTVPIYQGGRASAQVRQAKESLGQARIQVDVSRDQVRAVVAAAWSQYQAAQESSRANAEAVKAAQLALDGVIEERNVGQRTTLDVLNSQADLITAQINQVSAARDVVVASYAIVSATGRLSAGRLGLQVAEYQPEEHYNAVKDKWYGLRTPDGR